MDESRERGDARVIGRILARLFNLYNSKLYIIWLGVCGPPPTCYNFPLFIILVTNKESFGCHSIV